MSNIDEEEIIITLTLEDGEELECKVITAFESNNRNYIALMPNGNREEDEVEVLLFRYNELLEDEIEIENIETDEEFEIALKAFDQLILEE